MTDIQYDIVNESLGRPVTTIRLLKTDIHILKTARD